MFAARREHEQRLAVVRHWFVQQQSAQCFTERSAKIGFVRVDQGASAGAWWRGLEGAGQPKVIARLPFIERPDHPAGTPVLVVSQPLEGSGARDVLLYSARFERWSGSAMSTLARLGGEVIGSAGEGHGLSMLLAIPGRLDPKEVVAALAPAGLAANGLLEIGAHAERFRASPA